jgi:hypothetical protein
MRKISRGFDRVRNPVKDALGLQSLEMEELPHAENETPNLATKVICLIIFCMWLLGLMFPEYFRHYLALIPGNMFVGTFSHVWTLFTAGYIEPDFPTGLWNISVFALIAPLLERCYGSSLFIRFVVTVNLMIFCVFYFAMMLYVVMTGADSSLHRPESGFSGINAALLVGLKQHYPTKPILPCKLPVVFQFGQLPLICVCITFSLWMLNFHSNQFILIILGTYSGWVYLRYFMPDAVTLVSGDHSEEFAFATFFPNFCGLRSSIAKIANFLHWMFCPQLQPRPVSSPVSSFDHLHNTQVEVSNSLTVSKLQNKDPSIEKRRQAAIKAIDDKLATLQQEQDSSVGDIDLESIELGLDYPVDLALTIEQGLDPKFDESSLP